VNPAIVLPEPEGIPGVRITLDQPGMGVVCAGDPEPIYRRIVSWLENDQPGCVVGLALEDVKFGGEFYLTAHALRHVTSVERTYLIDPNARLPRGGRGLVTPL
jgi:hypothetical protein